MPRRTLASLTTNIKRMQLGFDPNNKRHQGETKGRKDAKSQCFREGGLSSDKRTPKRTCPMISKMNHMHQRKEGDG